MKTKRYSKKQMQEAIAFWTKILENKSPLIDDLVEEFGYDVVFGDKKVLPTLKTVNAVYDIVNKHLFNNKLVKCPIQGDRRGLCKKSNAAMEYVNVKYVADDNPSTYTLLTQIAQDDAGQVYYPPSIDVADETFDTKMSIVSLASMVAHEMIHQYTIELGDGCEREYRKDFNHESYDVHDNDEFNKFMDIANSKLGLNVAYAGSRQSYDQDSIDALKKFAGSDYSLDESDAIVNAQYAIRIKNGTKFIQSVYY